MHANVWLSLIQIWPSTGRHGGQGQQCTQKSKVLVVIKSCFGNIQVLYTDYDDERQHENHGYHNVMSSHFYLKNQQQQKGLAQNRINPTTVYIFIFTTNISDSYYLRVARSFGKHLCAKVLVLVLRKSSSSSYNSVCG